MLDHVQRRGGHRLALVVFAGRPQVMCPLTHDYDHFRESLLTAHPDDPLLEIGIDGASDAPASGTRIGAALRLAVELLESQSPGHQDVLLISDGDDPAGDAEWRNGIIAAKSRGIRVDTVGIGNPDKVSPIPAGDQIELWYEGKPVHSRLDEHPLEEIARQTGGSYIPGRTAPVALGEIFRTTIEPRPSREHTEDVLPAPRPQYEWAFAAALLCAALGIGMSDVRGPHPVAATGSNGRVSHRAEFALFIAVLLTLSASPADDALRSVQLGNDAFERGDFEAALHHFTTAEVRITDPGLVSFNKAATLYRLGRYRDAELRYLRCVESAPASRAVAALYNAGNAILQQAAERDVMRIENAIALYEQALQRAAKHQIPHEDVSHNLQLARELLAKAKQRASKNQAGDAEPQPRNGTDSKAEPNTAPSTGRDSRADVAPIGEQNGNANSTERRPSPGAGNLPVLPDTDDIVSLSAAETAAYLEQIAARVQQERAEHRRRHARLAPANVPDW